MKRTLALALTAAMILSLAACSKQDTDSFAQDFADGSDIIIGGSVQIPNPWTIHDTLADMNAATGLNFIVPDTADGLPISLVQEMGTLAEVRYSDGEREITLRKGEGTDDVSSDNNAYREESTLEVGGNTLTIKGENGTISLAVWIDDGYSYSISCSGLTEEIIADIAAAVK